MKSLKIALVCDWFLPRVGGIEINMKDLAQNLMARGHEVHVITALPGSEQVEGIRVHRLDVPVIPGVKLCYGKIVIRELKRLFAEEKFDLVHGHYLLSTLAHMSFYVARRMKIPTVFTHHSINGPLHNRVAFFLLPYLASIIGTVLFKEWVTERSITPDQVTAVSNAVAADLRQIYRDSDVKILPNGIDPITWHQPKKVHDKFNITSVMRLCKSKHPMKLIQAIARINKQVKPEQRPNFNIIGDGSQRRKMARKIEQLGLEDQVKLWGYRPREEIPSHLTQADLFVLPSTREGFGLAVLEARTAGVPVVAMNHGGVSDIIENGVDGFLTDTYKEFTDKIIEYIRNEELRERFKQNAERPLPHLMWDDVIARHLYIYQQAIANYPERSIQAKEAYAKESHAKETNEGLSDRRSRT